MRKISKICLPEEICENTKMNRKQKRTEWWNPEVKTEIKLKKKI